MLLGLVYLFISRDMMMFENALPFYTKKLLSAIPVADASRCKRELNLMMYKISSRLKPMGYEPPPREYRRVGEGHFVLEN